ncbi:glycoside hydrolase [bacterium]|nr:glycoside hydrolase [bacterium]
MISRQPLHIAFIWHMHQPYYKDLITGEYVMPWVRLHGIKDYYGMARLIEDFPDAHVTFSLTPCLLEQIQDYSQNIEQDTFIRLAMKPVELLTEDERVFILKNFFLANWDRMVKIYPRYSSLLMDRGYYFSEEDLRIKQRYISNQDIQDIRVWHSLAWMDTGYQRYDERISRLMAKGKNFDQKDMETIIEAQKEIISKIIPQYKKIMDIGCAELITTPYFHPIMPLLCNMSVAKVSSPEIRLPEMPLSCPEDCKAQLDMGAYFHKSVFGRQSKGIWPSEGSVSPEIIPMLSGLGIEWLATDEDILARSLDISIDRDLRGCIKNPSLLYKPYWIFNGGQKVIGVFRDRILSDQIGFVYQSWQTERAVEDFIGRLRMIHQNIPADERPGLVTIIMDGENAWEFYPYNGRDFLARLYGAICSDPNLKMVTVSEYLDQFPPEQRDRIDNLFPGSWINHNFKIWVGEEEDNTAWDYLSRTRHALEEYKRKRGGDRNQKNIDIAQKELYIAEGSDWFWWYGDEHFTEQADLFDHIFRKHLANIYNRLGLPVPNELHFPILINRVKYTHKGQPQAFFTPVFDGRVTSYFEWLPAVRFRIKRSGGTIHRAESILKDIYYGFDESHLYIRLDTSLPVMETDLTFGIHFLSPKVINAEICKDPVTGSLAGRIIEDYKERGKDKDKDKDKDFCLSEGIEKLAGDKILEIGIPFKHLNADPKTHIRFVVTVEKQGNEIERWPNQGYFLITTPYAGFMDTLWQP